MSKGPSGAGQGTRDAPQGVLGTHDDSLGPIGFQRVPPRTPLASHREGEGKRK